MLLRKIGASININSLKLKKRFFWEVREIRKSTLFDRKFYLNMYPDIADEPFWAWNPELHYLLHGASECRKPSKTFDTQWYLNNNEDVAESDLNPLLHYIRYGQREGRRINGNRYGMETRDERARLKRTIVNHLWGGYSQPALSDLATIYDSDSHPADLRFFAAWHAARWYFYVGDYETTFALAKLALSLDDYYAQDKAATMMYAHSSFGLGHKETARQLSEQFLARHPDDSDMLLTLANTCNTDSVRLEVINRIYAPRELALVRKREAELALSFDNITADSVPVFSAEKVSVIMPIFNAADKIEAAVRSLLEQSWQNLEIIAVDDRSTDGTFEILQRIAEKEPRVRAFQQRKNGGAYLARNRGLQEASGDYITTHDADDWSHPDKIATQVALLQRKEMVMGVCTHWTRALNDLTFTHNWSLNARLIHWNHSSFLFRKQVINELGPWDSVIVGGDTEFIWRVQAHYGQGSVVKYKPNIPFSFALDDDGSLTRTKSTHVNTIHNGLRHIYRGAAKWWHGSGRDLAVEPGARKFPAPKGMLKRGDNKLDCDVVVIADFSQGNSCAESLDKAEQYLGQGLRVGVMHWPAYKSESTELEGQFFELLLQENVDSVVYGMEVTCGQVLFQSTDCFEPLIERRPVIVTQNITTISGEISPEQQDYLRKVLAE